MENNGKTPSPTLTISYDPETQQVTLSRDPKQAKNWSFTLALLEMARASADQAMKMEQFASMQQAQMQAQLQQRIMSKLHT